MGTQRRVRLLQVEDDPSDAELAVRLLRRGGMDVFWTQVESAEQMRRLLAEEDWDVIIADYHMPQFGAPAALRILRESGKDIPFIVVSGVIGEDLAVEMMKSGAHDYLMKENLTRLAPAVEREIREAESRRERKRAEEERESLRAQFLHAQKMETVGRLAGGIAYDFNNLLTVMNGYAELLLEHLPPEDPLRDLVKPIRTSGDRAAALIGRLLAFCRKQVFGEEVLDLGDVVAEMRETIARLVGEAIEVETKADGPPATVIADRARIEQAMMNLIVNARDAMVGGGRLSIETCLVGQANACPNCRCALDAGPWVRLSVRDTGSGMDEETRRHLFEPFFTTKAEGKGTGLGLASVQGIVTQSGGHVCCQTTPGQGTVFPILLPATDRSPVPTAGARAEMGRGQGTLIVVEDEPTLRKLLQDVLEGCGYRVYTASGGEAALVLLSSQRADLLLTDQVMPGIGGRDLAARARALQPGIKVLLMSGYGGADASRSGEGQEAPPLIAKPFSPQALVRKIREVLGEA